MVVGVRLSILIRFIVKFKSKSYQIRLVRSSDECNKVKIEGGNNEEIKRV